MKGLFGHNFVVLEKAIDLRSRRNAVLAGNIANLDTPGYRSRDLPFERIMANYVDRAPEPSMLARTDSAHFNEHGEVAESGAPVMKGKEGNKPDRAGEPEVLVATDPLHFVSGDSEDHPGKLEVSSERGTPNNVDIDHEMAKLAENNIQYQAAVQMLVKKFELLKTAITEGGKA